MFFRKPVTLEAIVPTVISRKYSDGSVAYFVRRRKDERTDWEYLNAQADASPHTYSPDYWWTSRENVEQYAKILTSELAIARLKEWQIQFGPTEDVVVYP